MTGTLFPAAISVLELNRRLSNAIAVAPDVHDVWVIGETSDLRISGGHCFLELVEKGDDGSNRSRIRANIWANVYNGIRRKFLAATGIELSSGIKICARVTASYHPTYGMAVTIADIDPTYTAGDALRRRAEIIDRLTREGIIDLNRGLPWPLVPNRVAVISAQGAAGYGDFITHLLSNPGHLRFSVRLFPAVMQGERTVPSVLDALDAISRCADEFDSVVIIRGGGATTDLAAFDNYDLAAAVARCPLPVIVGIGHERDTTVLDNVAKQRVKTPTAAAELLIGAVTRVTDALGRAADKLYQAASERIAANRELLARAAATIPGTARQALLRHRATLQRYGLTASSVVAASVIRRREQLSRMAADIASADTRALERAAERLSRARTLLDVLSPDAVLARGYSLTLLPDGHVLRNPDDAPPGTALSTRLATGTVHSTVTDK